MSDWEEIQKNWMIMDAESNNSEAADKMFLRLEEAGKGGTPLTEHELLYFAKCAEHYRKGLADAKTVAERQRLLAQSFHVTKPAGRTSGDTYKGYQIAREIHELKKIPKKPGGKRTLSLEAVCTKLIDDNPEYAAQALSGSIEKLKKIYKKYEALIKDEEAERLAQLLKDDP